MMVLQPLLLWGLALAAVPILIHLLNRLRFKTVSWGAMQFLHRLSRYASRSSRLRHYLILACRALALALLALAMARPLAGGWLGRLRGRSAEAVLVLLDRSASMERRDAGGLSLRERAIEHIEQIPAELLRGRRIVFFDSAFRKAREVATLDAIRDLESSAPTDTTANWPLLLEAAADWIDDQQPGSVDIWMLSDAQTSNWLPGSRAWETLNRRLSERRAAVRVRGVIVEAADNRPNAAIRARDVALRPDGSFELRYTLTATVHSDTPLSAVLLTDGTRTQRLLPMPAAVVDGVERIAGDGLGWVGIQLPEDANPADNTAWFVFGPAPDGIVWVRAESADTRNRVRNAFRPARAADPHPARDWPRDDVPPLGDAALVIWQGAAPVADAAAALDAFVRAGGIVLALPPVGDAVPPAVAPDGWSWETPESSPIESVWRVTEWDALAGPFAQTLEGEQLPLGELGIRRRVPFRALGSDPTYAEARFDDRYPLLYRMNRGGGRIYALTSLPLPDWSDLGDGRLWVPMLWRLREEGARRLGQVRMGICGAWNPDIEEGGWIAVDDDAYRDPRIRAGVYRCGNRVLALNRPEEEDDTTQLNAAGLQALLPDVMVDVLRMTDGGGQPAEVSSLFLALAALCLLTEVALALSLHVRPPRNPLRGEARR